MSSITQWHIFFDTTETSTWRILDQSLTTLVNERNAQGFISALVIEEMAFQRLRAFRSSYAKLRAAAVGIEPYVDFKIGPPKEDQELLDVLRAEIRGKMPRWVTEIPTSVVTLDEILEMSKRRILPFRGDINPTGLHDAVILLSSIKYAGTHGLSPCTFVSSNTRDHSAESVRSLGARFESRWFFLPGTEHLLHFLRDPELTQTVTEALNRDWLLIEDYLRPNVLSEMLKMVREQGGLKEVLKVERLRIRSVAAVLDPPLQDDGDCNVRFHALVTLLVEGSTPPVVIPGGITRETSGLFEFVFSIEGQAVVRLERRKVVGRPRIVSIGITSMTY